MARPLRIEYEGAFYHVTARDGHWLLALVAYLPMICRTPKRVTGESLALRKSCWAASGTRGELRQR